LREPGIDVPRIQIFGAGPRFLSGVRETKRIEALASDPGEA
jgi:hypothetical protein